MFAKEFYESLKKDLKKVLYTIMQAKYRFCLQKIEVFIDKEADSLQDYLPSFLIDVFYIENYCCHQIVHKNYSGSKESVDVEQISSVLAV